MAKPMNTWGDFKKVLSELRDPQVKEIFQTIVVDTADIAYSYCERYICNRESDAKNSYDNISDLPFGKGYKLAMEEFDECIRKILQMDYGLVLISHAQDKTFKDEAGVEYNQIIPTLDNRARLVCERTCDIIGYSRAVDTEEGVKTKLFLRGTPRFVAGSRFRFTPPSIDFTYENLVEAIANAIYEEAKQSGSALVTNEVVQLHADPVEEYDYEALMAEFQSIVGKLMQENSLIAPKITQVVEKHLGKGKKVGDCTPDQASLIDLIVFDLKKL